MSEWTEHRLGEFFNIKHGFAFKGEHFTDAGDFVLLTPGNFKEEGGLKLKGDKEKYYSGEFPREYLLRKGDIVIAMTDLIQNAPILGSAAIIPEDGKFLHNQRLGKIIDLDERSLLPEFLYYLMSTAPVRGHIKGSATGSTVKHTAPSRILEVETRIPSLPTQRRIAGILSAYDELIANNQRRIAIQEEMARALYREWFVHYRAPDVVMGEDGVPEGWEVKPLLELANVTYGFPFDSKQFNTDGEGTPIIRIRDIPAGATETWTTQDAAEKYHVYDGEILVGMDGDFHMCMWSSGHAFQNQRVAKFTSRGAIGNYHLFLALERPIQALNRAIVGTTVAHLGAMHIKDIKAMWPTHDVVERTKAVLEPMAEQLLTLKKQTANLRRTRDLLLPRLMSGREEINTLEHAT